MSIKEIDGFRIVSSIEGNLLEVESDRLKDCMEYAIRRKISKIFIHGGDKYKIEDIDFLRQYDFFTHLTVSQGLIDIDISAVHYLHKLKYLSLSNGKQGIDFSNFPLLEGASIDWNNKVINFKQCKKLKNLQLWKYKPASRGFFELLGLNNLESLEITQSSIESFSGLEKLACLNRFEGYYLSKLTSLDGLENLKGLKTLVIENCKKIRNYESTLGKLLVLEKLILSSCGELDDIEFVQRMRSLKFFSFVGTNVKNGNLLTLKEKKMDFLGFDNKRHYSHKMKEINSE